MQMHHSTLEQHKCWCYQAIADSFSAGPRAFISCPQQDPRLISYLALKPSLSELSEVNRPFSFLIGRCHAGKDMSFLSPVCSQTLYFRLSSPIFRRKPFDKHPCHFFGSVRRKESRGAKITGLTAWGFEPQRGRLSLIPAAR